MNEVKIRPARPSDADAIRRCVEAAYRGYIARIGKPPGPMLDDFDDVIARHAVFVAQARDAIVGALVLIDLGDDLLLDNVAVDPAHQGRGIGRRLIELAESTARERGLARLILYSHERMTESIAMYRRAGYIEMERRTEHGYRRVYMQKPLA
ncbi:MAG: GNAT family N-acetyltransferase [bacterium]